MGSMDDQKPPKLQRDLLAYSLASDLLSINLINLIIAYYCQKDRLLPFKKGAYCWSGSGHYSAKAAGGDTRVEWLLSCKLLTLKRESLESKPDRREFTSNTGAARGLGGGALARKR